MRTCFVCVDFIKLVEGILFPKLLKSNKIMFMFDKNNCTSNNTRLSFVSRVSAWVLSREVKDF